MEFLKYNEHYIEGYLNSENNNGILIILKEPNTGDGDVRDEVTGYNDAANSHFWFRNIIDTEKDKNSYYRRLNNSIQAFVDEQKTLDNCIYINLSPLWGGKKASKLYCKVLDALKNYSKNDEHAPEYIQNNDIGVLKSTDEKKLAKYIVDNRIDLIEDLISNGITTIVTVPGIYERLKDFFGNVRAEKQLEYCHGFKKCKVKTDDEKEIMLYRVYHPKAPYPNDIYNYKNWKDKI